ncbi:MAG: presqualene diphosphate synthase HpnD [Ignavibacteriae bacterium]|nr:presqualene diphosphate synthase HpnD [Ignavibacteriota bacterium]
MISFSLLPEPKREAINTVYAFCRCTDDIVDEGNDEQAKHDKLARWTYELEMGFRNESVYPLLNKLNVIAGRFNIPAAHFFELIRGMRMDLEQKRYDTFEDLEQYCYRVASTVGLMCSEIFGYKNKRTLQYAIDLGIALQLTNIVRDVRSDALRDRIYIPLEDFERFGYTEDELFASVYNENFVKLMHYEAERARRYYEKARASLAEEDHRAFFSARIMDRIYYRILDKIEQRSYAVFEEKISISSLSKLVIAMREYFSRPALGTIAGA